MSDDGTNILRPLLLEIEDYISPLSRVADAPDPLTALKRFLLFTGWRTTEDIDPMPIVGAIGAITDAIFVAIDGAEPEDLGAFIEAIDAVRTLVTEITDLVDLIANGGPANPTDDELAAFGEDVLHVLAVTWLQKKPVIGDVASAVGLVEVERVLAMELGGWLSRRPRRVERIRPAAIRDLLSDPLIYLRERTIPNGWAQSKDAAVTNILLSRWLAPLMERLGGQWMIHPNAVATEQDMRTSARIGRVEIALPFPDDQDRASLGFEYEFYSAADRNGTNQPGPAVELAPFGGFETSFALGPVTLDTSALITLGGVDAGDSAPLLRFSGAGVSASPALGVTASLGATIPAATVIGGNGTRLELGAIKIESATEMENGGWNVGLALIAAESRLVLSAADLSSVVGAVANEFETEISFDLGLAWSLNGGVTLAGSAALEIEVTEGIDIGGVVKLDELRLRLRVGDQIDLTATTGLGVTLGPVALNLGGVGLGLELTFPPGGGNLGAANFGVSAEPPNSIGIAVDATVISGGGFLYLNPDDGEYAGILELSFPALSLSLKAVGIFTTDLPGDARGYAIALLVFTEFPAIQLGYGFTLNGVGGVLGIQHGVSIEALQSGMRSGILDSLLFPVDPVANAQTVLSNIRSAFPLSPGSLTFGPTLQIGWGQGIITISLGVIFQLDNVIGPGAGDVELARIVLLGQLKVELPPVDDAPEVVKLLVDILGYYDFEEQELGVDAGLRDSHIATLPLTGTLVIRARFGDDPTFIMAVGGLHPRFTDLPPGLPQQVRLGIQLRYGILRLQVVCYSAITSNSFQFGAEVSLIAEAASFKVEAYLGFDALFIFEPRFHFIFDFRVGAAISWKKWDLASIRVRGTVSGPGRWEVSGEASFSILFWDITVDFDEAWGSTPVPVLPGQPILPRVLAALEDPNAWSARLPGGRMLVTLRDPGADTVVLAHPLGRLDIAQKVMPLGLEIEKVGGIRPSDVTRIDIERIQVGDTDAAVTFSSEHFARGDYFDLDEDEKLTSPSFETFDAGVSFGSDVFDAPAATSFDPDVETVYLEQPDVFDVMRIPGLFLLQQSVYGAAGRTAVAQAARLKDTPGLALKVKPSRYAAVSPGDVGARRAAFQGTTYSEARAARRSSATPAVVVELVELAE